MRARSRSSSSSSAARATVSALRADSAAARPARAVSRSVAPRSRAHGARRPARRQLRKPALELGRALGGVLAHVRELRPHPASSAPIAASSRSRPASCSRGAAWAAPLRGELHGSAASSSARASAAADALCGELLGRPRPDGGGVRRRPPGRERDLLGGLRARRCGLGRPRLGHLERGLELTLARGQLGLQPARATLLLAEAGQRHRVGGAQQLAPAQALALLAELVPQPLDRGDRIGQRRAGRHRARARSAHRCLSQVRRALRARIRPAAPRGAAPAPRCGARAPRPP